MGLNTNSGGRKTPANDQEKWTFGFGRVHGLVCKLIFYCEKYTYHFLTIAICWCHPTHWPTLRNVLSYLKKPVSECGSRKPPNGHVTTPIGAIHCFCWPSLSVDVFLEYSFFLQVLWNYCGLLFVLK